MAENLVTQFTVEVLEKADGNARTTQLAAEFLEEATAKARTTQFVIEILMDEIQEAVPINYRADFILFGQVIT